MRKSILISASVVVSLGLGALFTVHAAQARAEKRHPGTGAPTGQDADRVVATLSCSQNTRPVLPSCGTTLTPETIQVLIKAGYHPFTDDRLGEKATPVFIYDKASPEMLRQRTALLNGFPAGSQI